MKNAYHPVIKAYIEESTTLLEILKRNKDLDEISNLMYRLRVSLQDSANHEELIQEAFNFNYWEFEPNLQFHFLSLLKLAKGKVSHTESKEDFLAHILIRLSGEINPVSSASFLLFNNFFEGDFHESIQRCMKDINQNFHSSPRYIFFLHHLMILIAQIGQLEPYISFYKNLDPNNKNFEEYIKLVSLQETNPLADTFDIYNKIKVKPEINSSVFLQTMGTKYLIRQLISKEKILTNEVFPSQDIELLKNLINANIALLQGDRKEALDFSRENLLLEFPDGFLSKTKIRAELASGNLKTAKLLTISASQNSFSLMNDFYLAQINLFEGNVLDAQNYMSKLNQIVEKYNAQELLDLEFKLAPHLTMSQIRFLTKAEILPNKGKLSKNTMELSGSKKITTKIIGESDAILNVKKLIKQYADLDQAVLIQGETGSGKELIAQALHEQSKRAKKPFLAINCASILGTILQSEFFGHESGAFTGAQKSHKGIFEAGEDGTVFLDEIGDISPEIQVALLRVLEANEIRPVGSVKTKPIHCRIIAATNANLADLVKKGKFRSDLYYRLQRLEIQSPALRERGDDIIILANYFLNAFYPQISGHVKISASLASALLNYDWPGNIRELKNEMEKMRLKNADKEVYDDDDATFLKKHTNQTKEMPIPLPPPLEPNQKVAGNKHADDHELFNYRTQFRRIELLKEKFQEHGRISREEAARIMNTTSKTMGSDFKLLQKEGFIEKVEPTKSPRTHYFIIKKSIP